MKVLMFVSNPFSNDARVYAEARSLVQSGCGVAVIARDRERQHAPRQNWDGIEIIRLRPKLLPRYGFASWLWNGLSLLLWQQQAYRLTLALNREECFDVIHCHDLDTLGIGTRLKRMLKIPLIYDAHEIYGYMMTRTFPLGIANLFLRLEKRGLTMVDRILTTSDRQRRYFRGITDKPVTIIMNCKSLQSLEYQPPDREKFTLLYVGSLHKARAIAMLVQTAKDLSGVRCLVGGIGQPDYVQALKKECSKTSNVTFLGRVPLEEVIPMTMKADVVFCMFNPADPNSIIGTPNKLFEAMVCGRPIICTKGTYSGELTEQEEIGLAVEYNEQALKEAITKLRDDPELRERLGRNALQAAITKHNWQKEEGKLLELYRSLQNEGQLSE